MAGLEFQTGYVVNLPGLRAWSAAFNSSGGFARYPEVLDILNQWFTEYQRFLIQRYTNYSMGSGNWMPLAATTLLRKQRSGDLPYILRATDLLYESFALDLVECDIEESALYIRVAAGGGLGVSYPNRSISAGEVLTFHQEGTSRMPARPVVVPPEQQHITNLCRRLEEVLVMIFDAAK